ncbi:hypothetical protein AVEN_157363-1 [Araneus ventricosus]|uniref:EGF-like domain-containing protein n=1 Tax=Araneus ventricosus TaxID=182803 RepID=A0A4Y2VRQ6_ARAVE|nr:hypothetical protein AVEN_157363-1 [Araneus ventricosus]
MNHTTSYHPDHFCDCGLHGRCSWEDGEKVCDCESGYRSFGGKCRECTCGPYGTCKLDESGEKVCSCDYDYVEKEGYCEHCDCNYLMSKRTLGVNCTFVDGRRQCICPPGFETSDFCEADNEHSDEDHLFFDTFATSIVDRRPLDRICQASRTVDAAGESTLYQERDISGV